MIDVQVVSHSGPLTNEVIKDTLAKDIGGKLAGKKVLALIPDHTRSLDVTHPQEEIVQNIME